MSKTIVLSDEDYKKVLLSGENGKEKFAIVDSNKFVLLSQFKWWLNDKGYAVTTQYLGGGRSNGKSKKIRMHRLIIGATQGEVVDHINRNRLDNRKSNLRIVTYSENNINQEKRTTLKKKIKIIKKEQVKDFLAALGFVIEED